MSTDPIRIDWDDLRTAERSPGTPPVPRRPDPPAREEVFDRLDTAAGGPSPGTGRSIHRRAWFYSTAAGLVGGALGWGVSELAIGEGESEDPLIVIGQTMLWSAIIGAMLTTVLASAESFIVGARGRTARYAALGAVCGFLLGAAAGLIAQIVFSVMLGLALGAGSLDESGTLAFVIAARGIGWAVLGGVCGMICGVVSRSLRKAVLGGIGGGIGGLVGGLVFDPLTVAFGEPESALLPRLIGLVLFAALTGLFVSLAEQIAKSTWLQVERGRLAGKQFIIYRNPTTIGSSPDCDIFLFKDAAVSARAATIERTPGGYVLAAERTVYVNGRPVRSHRLRNGDAVAIGETVLRFGEKR